MVRLHRFIDPLFQSIATGPSDISPTTSQTVFSLPDPGSWPKLSFPLVKMAVNAQAWLGCSLLDGVCASPTPKVSLHSE